MAKQSTAKAKKLRGEAMRAAAERKVAKAKAKEDSLCPVTRGEVDLDSYAAIDGAWRELGLAAPARRALIDGGLFNVSDLRKISLAALKELHGMGPSAIRLLVAAMKKEDLHFRK